MDPCRDDVRSRAGMRKGSLVSAASVSWNESWRHLAREWARPASDRAEPPAARLRLAVGFDPTGAWISAQYGELTFHKHTAVCGRETTMEGQCGGDVVSLTVTSERVTV